MTTVTTVSRDPAAPSSRTRDLTAQEAAEALQVSPRTVCRWATTGHIRAWRGGRAWRIPQSEIRRIKGEA